MEQHLLTIDELRNTNRPSRPMGKIADEKLMAFLAEAEQLHVKPILGDELFLNILEELQKEEQDRDATIVKLLDGGVYKLSDYSSSVNKDRTFYFEGLRKALFYYVYAQNVMTGDYESTRYGMVVKDGEYSSHPSDKSRSNLYNHITELANAYLEECIAYCKVSGLIKTTGKSKASTGGITIKRIG